MPTTSLAHNGANLLSSKCPKPLDTPSASSDENTSPQQFSAPATVLSGILFSRSVRSSFATFTLIPSLSNSPTNSRDMSHQQQSPVMVRLQFMDGIKELRSFCRKQYKIGDKIEFVHTHSGRWERPPKSTLTNASIEKLGLQAKSIENNAKEVAAPTSLLDTNLDTTGARPLDDKSMASWSQQPRWVLDLSSPLEAEKFVVVRNSRSWSMKKCQEYQLKYLASRKETKRKQEPSSTKKQKRDKKEVTNSNGTQNISNSNINSMSDMLAGLGNGHHGGGEEKRLQAEELAVFFLNLIGNEIVQKEQGICLSILEQRTKHDQAIREWCNQADGVLDVAGGCGHVSMALGMKGIASTVVDARASVGKLPRRDRKIWKRALQNKPQRIPQKRQAQDSNSAAVRRDKTRIPLTYVASKYEYCQLALPDPVVIPFQSQQAWFGSKPDGYDASFRHPNEDDIPVLMATSAWESDDACEKSLRGEQREAIQGNYNNTLSQVLLNNEDNHSSVLRRRASALMALHPDEVRC